MRFRSSAALFSLASPVAALRLLSLPTLVRARSLTMSATTATAKESYDKLKVLLREANALQEIDGILGYDEQCFMPAGAAAARADQKAALAKILHERRTGGEMREAIDGVRGIADQLDD